MHEVARVIQFPSAHARKVGGFISGSRCGCCGGRLYYDDHDRDVVCLACARRKSVRLLSERTVAWSPDPAA